jgi:hypothetical protein
MQASSSKNPQVTRLEHTPDRHLCRESWTPRRRIDVALHAVVMEAYVHGVSTRKVDDLVTALGAEPGISPPRLQGALRERDVLGAIQLGPPVPRPNHAATK